MGSTKLEAFLFIKIYNLVGKHPYFSITAVVHDCVKEFWTGNCTQVHAGMTLRAKEISLRPLHKQKGQSDFGQYSLHEKHNQMQNNASLKSSTIPRINLDPI